MSRWPMKDNQQIELWEDCQFPAAGIKDYLKRARLFIRVGALAAADQELVEALEKLRIAVIRFGEYHASLIAKARER